MLYHLSTIKSCPERYNQSNEMRKSTKWKETIKAVLLYPFILNKVKSIDSNIIFFFPRYQTGGAERVHINIIRSVSAEKPTCIITDLSDDKDFKKEFAQFARLIYLHRWGWKTSFRKIMARKIAKQINKIQNPVIFGSNSELFYDLFPHLGENCVKIDLLHTDLSHLPLSIENYASVYTHELTHRILLGEGHKLKLQNFYTGKGISLEEMSKLKIIPNGIRVPKSFREKEYVDDLLVLFVARNGYEKRPELFLKIASESGTLNLPYKFVMIGDFDCFQSEKPSNIDIVGKITDKNLLNQYYQKAHFIFVTSLFEGFPMVLLEGMSYGVIPISTDVGEIRFDVNEEKETGFIVPNDPDPMKIVERFIEKMAYLASNRRSLSRISLNCYDLVKSKFDETIFNKDYKKLLTNTKNGER